jgi:hypothetical protein
LRGRDYTEETAEDKLAITRGRLDSSCPGLFLLRGTDSLRQLP